MFYSQFEPRWEKFYYGFIGDSKKSTLEDTEYQIIADDLKRVMCIHKAYFISDPRDVAEDCKNYISM